MRYWKSFRQGFVGAFVLAGAMVMAVAKVGAAFARGELDKDEEDEQDDDDNGPPR